MRLSKCFKNVIENTIRKVQYAVLHIFRVVAILTENMTDDVIFVTRIHRSEKNLQHYLMRIVKESLTHLRVVVK